jgi:hypothetical protein
VGVRPFADSVRAPAPLVCVYDGVSECYIQACGSYLDGLVLGLSPPIAHRTDFAVMVKRERPGGRERERERESVCVCVCVLLTGGKRW